MLSRPVVQIGTLLLCLGLAGSASAATTPAQKCASAKMKAVSKAWAAKAKCYATALSHSTAVDPACLTTADGKYATAFSKIELAGGCTTAGNATPIGVKIDDSVEDIAGDLGCGNSVLDGDEACDDGNVAAGDGCSATCVVECGDGLMSPGEACDDGNGVNGDGCDNNCTVSACGNGIAAGAEACDDGNAVNGDGCDDNCTASACGNGVMAPLEGCDDGNVVPGDGCSNVCALETTCPCWTTATLNSEFPVNFFDLNGRGGAVCIANAGVTPYLDLEAVDYCTSTIPVVTAIARGGLFAGSGMCLYQSASNDPDPLNTGTCNGGYMPNVNYYPLTASEQAACYWTAAKSQLFQAYCP